MRLDARTALECHEYLHKSYAPNRFDLSRRIEDDEIVKEYKRQGLLHEEKVKDFLRTLPLRITTITEEQGDAVAQELTAKALLDPEIDIILGAHISSHCEGIIATLTGNQTLGDNSRVSRPDLLIRTGISDTNHPKWAPVDIKNHSAFDDKNKSNQVTVSRWPTHLPEHGITLSGKIDEEDGLQLAHYYEHLQNLGLASDEYLVAIIGREYEAITWAYLHQTKKGAGKNAANYLNNYYEDFLSAENIVKKALERNTNPDMEAPSIPKLISGKFGCDMCTFKVICREEMENFQGSGHVTLLAQVTPSIANKHFPEIESIKELSTATDLSEIGEKARRRAQVWLSKRPMLVDPTEPLDIPEFDIEVDIDLENSQALLQELLPDEVLPDDRVYLYGYGIHDRTVNKDWRTAEIFSIADFANTDEAEYKVLTSMWTELERIAAEANSRGKSLGIFHYSHHERTWWRRYASRFEGMKDVPTLDHVNNFMTRFFVDLLDYTRKVALPTTGYSIKTLAPLANFYWSVDNAGGATSLLKYKAATNPSLDDDERESAREWLINYNRDDVKATYAVRQFLRGLSL